MDLNRNSLQKMSLYRLREVAREFGVKAPTSLKKFQLINEIIDIQIGKTTPYFSNRGRPSLKPEPDSTENKEIQVDEKLLKIEKLFFEFKCEVLKILFEE